MATAQSNLLSPTLTASTKNFRESIHLLPTVAKEERPKSHQPPQLSLWLIIPAASLMVAMGIALEVALHISNTHEGFAVKEQNIFGNFASPDFLVHFIPVVFVAPLVLLWESKNWAVKRYQPYLNMARHEVTADDSLLLDYVSQNSVFAVMLAFKKRHWIVLTTAVAALLTLLLQPLAGSIFDIGQFNTNESAQAISERTLGLDPDRFNLIDFLAAAGYVQAAVHLGLGDPPFVHNSWAAADFAGPDGDYINGTLTTNTVGVRTNATCSAPTELTLTQITSSNFSISATSSASCDVAVFFDPAAASQNQQYGVTQVDNCGPNASLNVTFRPVFFWFYSGSSAGQNGAGVFCSPTLEVFNIRAMMSLSDNSLGNVTIIGNYTESNNVTGSPQNGVPFNGVIFEPAADNFTEARAVATQDGVPGAIIISVTNNASIAPNAFNSLDGFVDTTSRIYTQFLAVVAKDTYMILHNNTQDATITSQKPRLLVRNGPAQTLSILLIIMGLALAAIGITHWHLRKSFILTHTPGSIAGAVALTSHSGFGAFLCPYDSDVIIATKLSPLRFRLDRRTGAIIASDAPGYGFVRGDRGRDIGNGSESEEEVNALKTKYRDSVSKDVAQAEKPAMSRASTSVFAKGSQEGPEAIASLLDGQEGRVHSRAGSARETVAHPLTQSGYQIEPFDPSG